MRLSELIKRLEGMRDDLLRNGLSDEMDPIVVAAYQQHYPLAGSVLGAALLEDDEDGEPLLCNGVPVLWIAIGALPEGLSPYAPHAVFEEAS